MNCKDNRIESDVSLDKQSIVDNRNDKLPDPSFKDSMYNNFKKNA